MRFIDGSGTHTFNPSIVSGIDNYSKEKRKNKYTSIDDINSELLIGTSYFITFDFFSLNESERNVLNDIFEDNNLTSIDNYDEVLTGESYKTLGSVTNPIYIETSKIQFKKATNKKDILKYNSRLKIRFDSVASATK